MSASYRIYCILALLFVAATTSSATTCNNAENVQSNGDHVQTSLTAYYNSACKNPLSPYCTQTFNGTRCNYCDPSKFTDKYATCDCPPNQYCDPNTGYPTYATCIDFPTGDASCRTASDCVLEVSLGLTTIVGFWSCIANVCRPCNQSYYGNSTFTCPGGSPYPLSSRPGETRQCGADGYWVGGGSIVVIGGSTTNGDGSGSSGGTTSQGARPVHFLFHVFGIFFKYIYN